MQDEVTKHTKKIYDEIKNPQHSFSEKAKEVVIEIFIIVFAVTLSIWLHNLSEHKHEQRAANDFLKGLKKDITQDIKTLNENRSLAVGLDSNYTYLLRISKNQPIDSQQSAQIHKHLIYELTSTHLNTGRYDGFKSSGKMETIENDSLKEKILVFYQQTITTVTDQEDFLNNWQLKILDFDVEKDNRLPISDFIATDKMKGLLSLGLHNFEVNIKNYDEAMRQAKDIVKEIDGETGR